MDAKRCSWRADLKGVVTLFEEGAHETLGTRCSGKPPACGVPFGDGLKAMFSDLGSGAVYMGWNEEVADGGEDGDEVLQ
ncbi:hypothetical protein [Mesorhizobium sp. M1403]|uniref:hypothetical protein n=1 Tax=Mesorhizobium sp. M1403 TaxID=2957097 RepID=UPI00333AFA94